MSIYLNDLPEKEEMTLNDRDHFELERLIADHGIMWVLEVTMEEVYNKQYTDSGRDAYWRRMYHLLRTVKQLAA